MTTSWNATFHEPDVITQPNLTSNYSYDTAGRLTQLVQTDTTTTTLPYVTTGLTRTWNYGYCTTGMSNCPVGLLNTVSHPLCLSTATPPCTLIATATYLYNANGYVSSIQDAAGHTTTITAVNGFGEPTTSVDLNGVTTTYGYDLRGRLTGVSINPGASAANYGFQYDLAGNLHIVTLPDSSTLTYTYDNAHRLKTIANNLGETITYVLNALGNRTSTTIKSATSTIVKQQTATFDELGRMLTEVGAASQTTTYGYDKDDNQTSVTDPRSKLYQYAFDPLNRLYQETDPDTFQTTTGQPGYRYHHVLFRRGRECHRNGGRARVRGRLHLRRREPGEVQSGSGPFSQQHHIRL